MPANALKSEIRRRVLKERESLSLEEVSEKSRRIMESFLNLRFLKTAETIMLYMSFRNEVQTTDLIQKLLAQGKRVLLPRTVVSNKQLEPYEITSLEGLVPGVYGILEPAVTRWPRFDPSLLNVVVVPGVAFDRRGYRIGYGGGYYDRFLRTVRPEVIKVSIIYDLQLIEEIPNEPHDVPVDLLVTETRVIVPERGSEAAWKREDLCRKLAQG